MESTNVIYKSLSQVAEYMPKKSEPNRNPKAFH